MNNANAEVNRLVGLLRQWRFVRMIAQRLPDSALIMDILPLEKVYAPDFEKAGTTILDPEEAARTGLPNGVRKALVVTHKGEWQLVKRLRARHPNRVIRSLTYEAGAMMAGDGFRWRTPHGVKGRAPRFILLSQAGSDAEFFRHMLKAAGYPAPHEYITPAHIALGALQDDFSVQRLFHGTARMAGGGQGYAVHMQSDVLFDMIDKGGLDPKPLMAWIKREEIKLIHFVRRDKLFHLGMNKVLEGAKLRSLWTRSSPTTQQAENPGLTVDQPLTQLDTLIAEEARLERLLKPLAGRMKTLTFEDVVAAPAAVMEDMRHFLGEPEGARAPLPHYGTLLDGLPGLSEFARTLRGDIIDRLGLHVNAEGSFVSASVDLLEAARRQVKRA